MVKFLVLSTVFIYAVLVLSAYAIEGPEYRVWPDMMHPLSTAKRFFVWVGVRAMAAFARLWKTMLGTLSETSADVGVWVVEKGGSQLRSAYRSRFL